MSGLALPPANPPADAIDVILERIRSGRSHLTEAMRQEQLLEAAIAEAREEGLTALLDYLRTERRVARNRTVLWTRNIRALERRARALGVQP